MQGEWLRTGDMFYQDADGYFYFCGRGDDMLKVGGMWVSPAEVEAALGEHPAVAGGRGDRPRGRRRPHQGPRLLRAARRAWPAPTRSPPSCGRLVRKRLARLQVPALGRLRGRAAQDRDRQDPAVRARGGAGMRVVVERVSKTYHDRARPRRGGAPARWTSRSRREEFVAMLGPSGCGKSTLLNIIAGLLPASAGRVYFEGEPRPGAPLTATVFQEFALFPWRTVRANVEFGLEELGVPGLERAERDAALPRHDRPRRLRGQVPAPALGRHAPAGGHRAGARGRARGAAAWTSRSRPSTPRPAP